MEPLNDSELHDLLRQWEAPGAPPHLELRVLGGRHVRPWYRWLLTGVIRIPVPALTLLLAIFCVWTFVLLRNSQAMRASAREVRLSDFQPVSELKPRIIGRTHESN